MLKRLNSHWLLFIALVILVLIAALPTLSYPMGRDQGMYANIGRSILYGGTPYVDMWDIKPPPIYYIYAAGIQLFGNTTAAIRAIDLSLIPVGMLGLYLLARRMAHQGLGLLAALIYAVFYFNEDFQNLTQSDSLVTILLIWAVYAAFRASQSPINTRQGWLFALLTGAICGLILWFKQYYAFFVLALVLNQVISRLTEKTDTTPTPTNSQDASVGTASMLSASPNRKLIGLGKESLAFAIGGLLTGGTLLLYFWSQGMISEMIIIAQGTAAYNAQGYDFGAFIANMGNYLYFRWLTWHLLLILTALWWVIWLVKILLRNIGSAQRRHSPTDNGVSDSAWRLIIIWLISTLAFALIQAKGFDTHWIPMLPAMSLMAADVIDKIIQFFLWRKTDTIDHVPTNQNISVGTSSMVSTKNIRIVLYILAVIGLLSITVNTTWGRAWDYLSGQESQIAYWDKFQANDLKPEQSLEVVNFLRERVVVGDSLFIWGFRPEVYFMAELWSASRYQAQFPLVAPWYPIEWQQNNVDILWAAMPPYVLILQDDFMPWVTDFDADSHTLLQDYTELNNWLIANYERVEQIGDFIIWRRSSP
jgi:dolichyl-phosphate-mannose-protein mannosyltransferase